MNVRLIVAVVACCFLGVLEGRAQQAVVAAPRANVRRSPSSKSGVLEKLSSGDTVTLLSATKRNRYYHVAVADGERGWILSNAVRVLASADTGQATMGTTSAGGWPDSIARWAKPPMTELDTGRCAAVGAGIAHVDSATDLRKNRVDQAAAYQAVPAEAILALPWQGLATKRFGWSAADNAKVATYEGVPVALEGYLGGAKEEGKEATNCELDTHPWHDWHVWVVATPDLGTAGDRRQAIVVEVTPRVRAGHPGWSLDSLMSFHQHGTRVRISGWLMLDPDHPDQVGNTRGTTWEIHPVTKIEFSGGGAWQDLDAER